MTKNIKRNVRKIIITSLLGIFLLTPAVIPAVQTFAADSSYTVLTPLPFTTEGGNTGTGAKANIKTYLEGMFKLLIGLSAVAAVVNIVIGGFQYLSTDAINGKSDGRTRINNAVLSLFIIVGAWLILNTINPNIFKFDLNISSATVNTRATVTVVSPATLAEVKTNCPNCLLKDTGPSISPKSTKNVALNCTTCIPIDKSVPDNGNSYRNIVPSVNTELVKLAASMPKDSWTLNEAYPPTAQHGDSCHYNGTCVDAGPKNLSSAGVLEFDTKAKAAGFKPGFEVRTKDDLIPYKDICVSGKVSCTVNDKATGPHFHME